jgi:nitrate reductase alpha subunit
MEPWSAIAFGKDWIPPSRLQNSPSWHYMQFRSMALRKGIHGLSHRSERSRLGQGPHG